MSYLTLLRLREIASIRSPLIQKAKVYLAGRQPPDGVKIHQGPRGKPYYMSEDLKALKESKKKDTPKKEETGEKKKRLPAFKRGNYDELTHRTKTGEHGPGTYEIRHFEHHGKHTYNLSFNSALDPSKSKHIATSKEIYSEKGSKEHQEAIKHLKTLVGEAKQKETPKGPEKPKQRLLKDINADLKDFDIVTDKQKYFRRYLERESKKKSLGGYSLAHTSDGMMVLSHPDWGTHQMSFSSDEDLFKQFEGGINQDLTKVLRAGVQDFDKNPLKHDQKAYLAWQKKKYDEKRADAKQPELKPKISSEGGKMSVPTFGYDRLKLTDSEYTNEELGQMIQAIHDDPHYKNKTGGTYILNPTGRKRSENIAWAITNRKMRKKY